MNAKGASLRKKNEFVLGLLFIVLFVVFSFLSEHFFQLGNVMNLFAQMVELGLLTIGMTASLLSGGMDLSVGALCSLSTVLCATFIGKMGMPVGLTLLAVFGIIVICGALNGFLVGYLKITPMLVTLGTLSLFTGIGLVVSEGVTVPIPTDQFAEFGRMRIGGVIPFQVVMYIVVILISIVIFNYMKFGRRVYLIGSNPNVARFAGINLPRNLVATYVFSAFTAFVAALVMASRVSSGRADIASALVLKSVSAAMLGGVSVLGGVGTIGGAILGVAVITVISNGMDMMNMSRYIQQITIGCMLLIVLAFRYARRK